MFDEEFAPDTTPEKTEDLGLEAEDFDLDQEEEIEEAETEEKTAEEQAQEEAFLQIKYNKEEKKLSKEEATILAQKGMNYDKIVERLNSYENDPNLSYLNSLAQKNNMDLGQLVNYWKQQEEEAELNELLQQNIPEEYAREMLESKKFREELQRKEYEAKQQQRQEAEFKDFFQAFPGTVPDKIPPEVWEKRETEGIPLKYAYMEHMNNQLIKEKEILLNNNKNRKKAPGLGVTKFGSGDTPSKDPFLEGFDE